MTLQVAGIGIVLDAAAPMATRLKVQRRHRSRQREAAVCNGSSIESISSIDNNRWTK